MLAAVTAVVTAGCGATAEETVAAPGSTTPTAPRDGTTDDTVAEDLRRLERVFDARLGLHALDTATGAEVTHRSDERFAFASTGKALVAAALLDATTPADLRRTVDWTRGDLVTYSPFTEPRTGSGATLGELAEAMVRESDNTAANLVVRELGGLDVYAAALRGVDDTTTRPARLEPGLNAAVPGDDRDTSTPRALAHTLRAFAVDGALAPDDAAQLDDWMSGNATGDTLVRAAVPEDWRVADKSGAASYGTRNDVAVVHPPGRAPLVVVVMSSRTRADASYDDRLVARAARVALDALG